MSSVFQELPPRLDQLFLKIDILHHISTNQVIFGLVLEGNENKNNLNQKGIHL
jgi:hypothetical protein